jgi:VIT1/CCC1 family predicted Fe2+/Mn2+ transporter
MNISPFGEEQRPVPPTRRWSPRVIAENTATVLIAAGVIMLMQPFSLTLYSWSFIVMLVGTALFVVGSKFPG